MDSEIDHNLFVLREAYLLQNPYYSSNFLLFKDVQQFVTIANTISIM